MYTGNPEREKKVRNLRLQGLTIDEISLETGIPRSSVGYYVKKFKSANVTQQRISKTATRESIKELVRFIRIVNYDDVINRFGAMWKQGKYHEIREMSDAYFAITRMTNHMRNQIAREKEMPKRKSLDELLGPRLTKKKSSLLPINLS